MNKLALCMLFFITFGSGVFAQDNPFYAKDAPAENKQVSTAPTPGFLQAVLNGINNLQRELNKLLSTFSRKITQEHDLGLFFLLLGLTLVYGLVHAIGPGHGKTIVVSYTLSNPMEVKQGIWLGIFISVIHTLSAVLLVSLLYFFLESTYSHYAQEPKRIISLVSYGLIAAMGMFLLIMTIVRDVLRKKKIGDNPKHESLSKDHKIKNLIIPAFIVGLVPCEGAILILVFSISISAYWLGILLTAAMSIGMALTISMTGIITLYSKKGALKLLSSRVGAVNIISIVIKVIGAAAILCFGLLLFLSRL